MPKEQTMKNIAKTTKGSLSVQTAIKAGGLAFNHNVRALKVRAAA